MGKKVKKSSKNISNKKYEKELYKLQAELCQLQEWVVETGARVIVVFEGRDAARKHWKLSPMDLESHRRWYDYSRTKDRMFKSTDSKWAPWNVVDGDIKKRARLNCISHLLSQIPYEKSAFERPELPPRQDSDGYIVPDYPYKWVPAKY